MRSGLVLTAAAAAVAVMSVTGAQAEGWCGYAARAHSFIECGYSTSSECQDAIGKGGMCFVDPDYALDATRASPVAAAPRTATKPAAGRS